MKIINALFDLLELFWSILQKIIMSLFGIPIRTINDKMQEFVDGLGKVLSGTTPDDVFSYVLKSPLFIAVGLFIGLGFIIEIIITAVSCGGKDILMHLGKRMVPFVKRMILSELLLISSVLFMEYQEQAEGQKIVEDLLGKMAAATDVAAFIIACYLHLKTISSFPKIIKKMIGEIIGFLFALIGIILIIWDIHTSNLIDFEIDAIGLVFAVEGFSEAINSFGDQTSFWAELGELLCVFSLSYAIGTLLTKKYELGK